MKPKPAWRFTPDGRELVMGRPDGKRPWMHYLASASYGLAFSQTGGGGSWHPIKAGAQLYPRGRDDRPGRYVYVRDTETGAFWSINWQPVRARAQAFECRFGPGYARIASRIRRMHAALRVFVDPEYPVECWTITLHNVDARPRSLAVFPFVEWSLSNQIGISDDLAWYTRAGFARARIGIVVRVNGGIDATGGGYTEAIMAAGFRVHGYTCSRAAFLGSGDYAAPAVLCAGRSDNMPVVGELAVGCLEHRLRLRPGERRRLDLWVGIRRHGRHTPRLPAPRTARQIDARLARVRRDWARALAQPHFETPDPALNRWLNIWLKYQLFQCVRWEGGNTPNLPSCGFRDNMQWAMGMAYLDPEAAKSLFLRTLRYQFAGGRAVRSWVPQGAYSQKDYRDSPVWIVLTLATYLKATGDFRLMEQSVPYLDRGRGTALDHALAAINALWNDRGRHGLSHIGGGDWLDPLNRCGVKGRGESVWLAMVLRLALHEMAALLEWRGRTGPARRFRAHAAALKQAINRAGWDGAWYRQAYDDSGTPVGSARCREGKIFLMPQAWSVLSATADEHRARQVFAGLDRHLRTSYGYRLFAPAYRAYRDNIGALSVLHMQECVYMHANAFKIMADFQAGRGAEGYATFQLIDPTNPAHPPENSLAEPHIMPNGYFGPPQKQLAGRVMYSGFSGGISWLLRAFLEGMFGIQPLYDEIVVDPCLPPQWPECRLTIALRGAEYDLVISNPDHVSKGVAGLPAAGNRFPYFRDGRRHSVSCVLGKPI